MKFAHISKFILLVSVLSLVGFGCKGLSAEQKAAVKPVTVNYWTVYNDVGQLQKLATDFHKLRPNITVNIRQVRYEEFDKLFTNALADDVGPDIISVHTRVLRSYLPRLVPMPKNVTVSSLVTTGKYIKDTSVISRDEALPTAREIRNQYVASVPGDVLVGEAIYGLPLAFDTMALFYNKDLLDKAGIPEPPRNWGEFLSVVKKTTKFDKDGKIIQSGVALGTGKNIEHAADLLALLMLQNNVRVVEGNSVAFAAGLDKKPNLNQPVFEALRFYTDFADPTKEAYAWNDTLGSAYDNFARGKSAFYFGFAYDLPRLKSSAPQMNLEVISVPQLNEGAPVNVANYWVESVVKKSKHQNEAWDFVRFMASPDNVEKYTSAIRAPSPIRAQIEKQKSDQALAPFASAVLVAQNWYRGRDLTLANQALADLVDNYRRLAANPTPDGLKKVVGAVVDAARLIQQTM